MMIEFHPLAEKAEIIRGVTFSKRDAFTEERAGTLPVVRAGNIQEQLDLDDDLVFVPKKLISDRQRLRRGDIVMCTSSGSADVVGKTAYADNDWNGSFGAFCAVVRPKDGNCNSRYLFHYLRSPQFRNWTKKSSGANIKNIRKSELDEIAVPFPQIDEQRRIAAILDKADAIRRKRQQALAIADEFLKSVFLEMFGDPVKNRFELEQRALGKSADFVSGATPSKGNSAFWDGDFPWVSPKDMKVETILDAQDHVSKLAFEQTNLKRISAGTPLIVVRGMILAHTVPMAMTGVDVAINQDMKGVLFDEDINPVFGYWCLRVQHQHILDQVDTAAHGTKRLDMDKLKAIPIHMPGDNLQEKFVGIVEKFSGVRKSKQTALHGTTDMFLALSQRAFRGEL